MTRRISKREAKRAIEELREESPLAGDTEQWVRDVVDYFAKQSLTVEFVDDAEAADSEVEADIEHQTDETDDEADAIEYVTIARSSTDAMAFVSALPRESLPDFVDEDELPIMLDD
jgi:undecaprenyl pyrophosphate synthase